LRSRHEFGQFSLAPAADPARVCYAISNGIRRKGTHMHWVSPLVALAMIGTVVNAAEPTRRPNVVFILADDLGYGDVGCFGQDKIQTPRLDELAKGGLRFTQCYSGSTVCAPSRACLLLGQHTGHAHIRGNLAGLHLRAEDVTVAERLQKAGYRTGCVGKYGLGETDDAGAPNKKGFDHFFGYLTHTHAHTYYPEYLVRNTERVPQVGNVESSRNVAKERTHYAPDVLLADALQFLRTHQQEPFFLYYAPPLPHANNERGKAEGNGMEVPTAQPYTDRPWPATQKNHAAMITRLDTSVGAILDELKKLKLDEHTIVFFSSDNGPHKEGGADPAFFRSAGPFRGFKRDLTDGGIRVPTLVRWPGHIQPGTSDLLWAFWDFAPTALDLAGLPPAPSDGLSIVPTLLGKGEQKQHEYLYWEFYERGFQQAVRIGQWKALRLQLDGPIVLYDTKADVEERTNVADQHPDIVKQAQAAMQAAHTPSPLFSKTLKKK
jgi:arylsulfatase A-like enzyme